jgi:hypothetical protein
MDRDPRATAWRYSGGMTSATRAARHRYSYDEYLAYERDSGMKHEYDGGEIVAMAGGSRRHNALASRVSAAIENARPSGGVAFQSDQRVRILATGKTRCCRHRPSRMIAATSGNTTS